MIDSYNVLWSSYDRHKLICKVMIINKNSNHSQPLKIRCLHYEWWVNWFEEVQQYITLFTVRLNIRVINDVKPEILYTRLRLVYSISGKTAMKTFRAERRYSIRYRVLDRATNWKPINAGRVRCNSLYMTREHWRKFIFTVNSYRFIS